MSEPDDRAIRELLESIRTVAVIGASPNPARPSHGVTAFLIARGYQVYPVNPGHAGSTLLGRAVYPSLSEVPAPVDMVDVFRNSAAAGGVIDEAIRLAADKQIRAVWLQLGVVNEAAAARARAAGLIVVMDRCPKIEYARLRLG
jgi:predicted CoA-binding protein